MSNLRLTCPFCSAQTEVADPGDYAPRYRTCEVCARRYIYEPTRSGVLCLDPLQADCCSDPDCRAREMGASGDD